MSARHRLRKAPGRAATLWCDGHRHA